MRALTAKQARQILQISKPTFYRLIRSEALTAFRIGRDWRVSEDSLRDFMKKGVK